MVSFEVVTAAIDRERDYQDKKHGSLEKHSHSQAEWLAIMNHHITEALDHWYDGKVGATQMSILKVVASGTACLEQHGVLERDFTE